MPIDGRRRDIDLCIADIVAALNAANITTVASCCGHGKTDGDVLLKDGRKLVIKKTRTTTFNINDKLRVVGDERKAGVDA